MKTTLQCIECGEIFVSSDTVSVGGLPRCGDCGGALTIPGILDITCCNCDFRQTVAGINVNECAACPKCGWALDVIAQNLDADITGNVDDTIQKESDLINVSAAPAQQEPGGETIALLKSADSGDSSGAPESDATIVRPPEASSASDDGNDGNAAARTGLTERVFGKYEILEEIARGGMGIVYKVYDPDLRRELALKVLIAGEGASEELLKRFLREARAAARLNHPNVVPVHEVGQIKGQYYFTMELIEGVSFDKIIASKWMPVDDMIRHIRDIARALKTAHDAGIIHRDIKPANIMFEVKNERALLTDFGLAKEMDSNTMLSMTGMMMGSPAYMSPEQARGMIHDIDKRADIYSLGVVMFEAVTGRQAFSGATVVEIARKVVYDDPEMPRKLAPGKVNSDLQNIILKCMEKDKQKRYMDMQELIQDLEAYLDGRKVLAKAPSPLAIYWRKLRRKPVLLAAVLGAPLAAAIVLLLLWYHFLAPKPLDLAEEAVKSGNAKRQAGAVSDIDSWIREGKISTSAEMERVRCILEMCLHSGSSAVKAQACLALEKLKNIKAVPALVKLLEESGNDDKTQSFAIAALRGLAAEKGADKASISGALFRIAEDRTLSEELRLKAVYAAPESWTKDSMRRMLALAEDRTEHPEIRTAAIASAASKLTMGSPSMYHIIRLTGDRDRRIRQAAIDALGSSRSRTSILDLYGLKGATAGISNRVGGILQKNAENQQHIMDMINEMETHVEKKKTPLEIIAVKLRDKSPEIRLAAAYDLGSLGNPDALPLLLASLTDEDDDVVCVASESIARLWLSRKMKPELGKITELLDDSRPVVRERATYLLGRSGDMQALRKVSEAAEAEDNAAVIQSMAEVLKNLEADEALPVLDKLLKKSLDKSTVAAGACIKTIKFFGKKGARRLIPYLAVSNSTVKKAVIAALSDISGRNYGNNAEKWRAWAEK